MTANEEARALVAWSDAVRKAQGKRWSHRAWREVDRRYAAYMAARRSRLASSEP